MSAVANSISLEEYLEQTYEPEREFISGELVPKPVGTLDHSHTAKIIELLLDEFARRGLGRAERELSIRKGDDVRIPDIVFFDVNASIERGILIDPPMLCVEILSPSQYPSQLFAKCEAYHAWGVSYCWVVDPVKRCAWEYHKGQPVTLINNKAPLTADQIQIQVAQIF
ncbi:MAG: Uma2 family endonuclease [Bryobacteraceae bacterium]